MWLKSFSLSVLATDDRESVSVEVERMLRLAEQCLERAKSFLGKSVEPASSSSSGQPEPIYLDVHAATTATSSGEEFLSHWNCFVTVQSLQSWPLPLGSQTKTDQCVFKWFYPVSQSLNHCLCFLSSCVSPFVWHSYWLWQRDQPNKKWRSQSPIRWWQNASSFRASWNLSQITDGVTGRQ